MAQIFHRSFNTLGKVAILGLPLLLGSTGLALVAFYRSSYATGTFEVVEQPVPFSHLHHVGQLGIDCRFCHNSVETSGFAGLPATEVCMKCHQQMWTGADMLGTVRQSWKDDKPIVWNQVHKLPEYAYFNHSIHVGKGVGCVECHGQVDKMPLIFQSKTLLMEWCLRCHRAPEGHLRPKEEVFSMTWTPDKHTIDPETKEPYPTDKKELGALLKDKYGVRDARTLTSCSMCHR